MSRRIGGREGSQNQQAPAMAEVLEELVAEWSEGGIFGDRAGEPTSVVLARAILRAIEGDNGT